LYKRISMARRLGYAPVMKSSDAPAEPESSPEQMRRWLALLLLLLFLLALWLLRMRMARNHEIITQLRENNARRAVVEIAGAVGAFYSDYDRLPVKAPDADWRGTTVADCQFLLVLTGREHGTDRPITPKHINYLEGFKGASSERDGKSPVIRMRDGIDDYDPECPKIYDPWGQAYYVIMDTDDDKQIKSPLAAEAGRMIKGKKALVYSTGPPESDGSENTDESKFIKSW